MLLFQKAQVVIKELICKDSKRREKILEIYEEISGLMKKDDDLQRTMKTDLGNFILDLDKLRSTLRYPECPILVAGISLFIFL